MKLNKGQVRLVFEWCKKNYGRSRYAKTYPLFSLTKFDSFEECMDGYYEPIENAVKINSSVLREDALYAIETVIEEYIHYTQSDSQYQKLCKQYAYSNHPFEIAAKATAKKDSKRCLREMKLIYPSFRFIK